MNATWRSPNFVVRLTSSTLRKKDASQANGNPAAASGLRIFASIVRNGAASRAASLRVSRSAHIVRRDPQGPEASRRDRNAPIKTRRNPSGSVRALLEREHVEEVV